MDANPEVFHQNGKDDKSPSCKWWYKNDGNCRITHCYVDEVPEGQEGDTITGGQIFQLYDQVRSRCVDLRAGGEFTGARQYLYVYNDEDQFAAAAAVPNKATEITHDSGVVEGSLTLEEFREWQNDTATAMEAGRNARRDAALLQHRQNDDDDSVRLDFVGLGLRNPDAFENGPRLGKGVEYKYEVSESTKFGVTTNMNIGGAWNVFTASIGIEMPQEDTYTVTEGLTFNVDCDNQGQVTFWPFYDFYEVTFFPSDTSGEIWVPVPDGDKKVSGEIAVACVG